MCKWEIESFFDFSVVIGIMFILSMFMATATAQEKQILKAIKEVKMRKDIKNLIVNKTILSPKIYIKKKGIEFLDGEGKIKKEYLFNGNNIKVAASKNSKYVGVSTILEFGAKGEVKNAKFTMLDDEGNIKWEITHNLHRFIPSSNGNYAIGIPSPEWGESPLYLYSETGIIKEIQKLSGSYGIDFSEDGKWLVLATNNPNNKKSNLVLFSEDGSELWRIERDGGMFSPTILKDGNKIAVIIIHRGQKSVILALYDNKGKLLWEDNKKVSSSIIFSSDSKYLFAPGVLYEVATGKVLWSYGDIKGYAFGSQNLELILVIGSKWEGYKKIKDTIDVLNLKGDKLLHEEYSANYIEKDSEYIPQAGISLDGEKFFIHTKEGIKFFRYKNKRGK